MKDEVRGACSMHRKDEKCIPNFSLKAGRERPLGRPRRSRRTMLKFI
jgi:hypothetical protein